MIEEMSYFLSDVPIPGTDVQQSCPVIPDPSVVVIVITYELFNLCS